MKYLKQITIATFILFACSTASAAVLDLNNGNIDALEVNGELYNVDWNRTDNPGAGDLDLFDGDSAFANSFMDAVMSLFNDSGLDSAVTGINFYGVDYSLRTGALAINTTSTSAWGRYDGSHGVWSRFSNAAWGEVTMVPEPSMLALLGIGLVGFGVARSRRKS